jgi:hypothetical protein
VVRLAARRQGRLRLGFLEAHLVLVVLMMAKAAVAAQAAMQARVVMVEILLGLD